MNKKRSFLAHSYRGSRKMKGETISKAWVKDWLEKAVRQEAHNFSCKTTTYEGHMEMETLFWELAKELGMVEVGTE